jgi:hypothetical protein
MAHSRRSGRTALPAPTPPTMVVAAHAKAPPVASRNGDRESVAVDAGQ